MSSLLIAASISLIVSIFGTALLIEWLPRRGIGQQVREDGPPGHVETKSGTPTMGGIAIVIACVAGYLVPHVDTAFTSRGLLAMGAIVCAGLVGFLDDWIKQTRRRSLGLNKRAKAGGQLLVAIVFALLCVHLHVDTHLSFTRYDWINLQLGSVIWCVLAVLVIIGSTNAVNFTDGLDGLAAGSSGFTLLTFMIIGFVQFKHFNVYHNHFGFDEAIVAGSLVGACIGFLWWNGAPARIFMGDTGSLAIGAGVAVLALLEDVDLLLPIAGALFVIEALSVILQIGSFRLFRRRIFRMAPIHHHFELLGWPETTVIIRFWIMAGAFTALALGIFYADFLSHGGG